MNKPSQPEYQIINGREVRDSIYKDLKSQVSKIQNSIKPQLTFILVGNNPASHSYIRQKQKACNLIGYEYDFKHFPETLKEQELIQEIFELNEDPSVHGIMVQLPLPNHISADTISSSIDPAKDVDGFHPINQGIVSSGSSNPDQNLEPCTPKGIIRLLQHYKIPIQGADATVVGRSQIVGKPVSSMLLNHGATVTTCHSKTKDLKFHTSKADILVVATGQRHMIKADMVKPGAVVIDVGFSKVEDDIYGDVDFLNVAPITSYITPVPGGVGPMTVACLMENLMIAYQNQTS
jgi:methylenetetrahydrofolate dehydrogenase (NADP+)/methenyltetrahydrofolate cyclohydrolase